MKWPRLIAIAGGSASGKTTLVRALRLLTPVAVLEQDAYYRDLSGLSPAERKRVNFDAPEAVDLAGFERDAARLCAGLAVSSPCYDFVTHTRTGRKVTVSPEPIVVLVGLHVCWLGICGRKALNVYLDTPDAERFRRRLERDTAERGRAPEETIERWRRWVLPMHYCWVAPQRGRADLVMSGMDPPTRNARRILGLLGERRDAEDAETG